MNASLSPNPPSLPECLTSQELQTLAAKPLADIQRDERSLAQMEHLLGCDVCRQQFSKVAEVHVLPDVISATPVQQTSAVSVKRSSFLSSPLLVGLAALMLGAGVAGAGGFLLGRHRTEPAKVMAPVAPAPPSAEARLIAVAQERDLFHTETDRLSKELKRLQDYKAQQSVAGINALAKRLPKPPPPPLLPSPDKIKREQAEKSLADRGQQIALMNEAMSVLRREIPTPEWARIPLFSLFATPTFSLTPTGEIKIESVTLRTSGETEAVFPCVQGKPSLWKPKSPLPVGKWLRWEIKGTDTARAFTSTGRLKVLATDDADLRKRFVNSPQTLTFLRQIR